MVNQLWKNAGIGCWFFIAALIWTPGAGLAASESENQAPPGAVFLWSKTVTASIDDVMGAVKTATGDNNFPISQVRDYGKNFSKRLKEVGKGELRYKEYRIIEACNVMLAIELINTAPGIGAFLPCQLFVYQFKGSKQITVATVNPNYMAKVLNTPKLLPVLVQLSKVMGGIFQELDYLN